MTARNTLVRSLHDVGAAVWLGGALMGAVGLNGAASDIKDRRERAEIAADGWARWAPVNAAAIGTHLVGGLGLLLANRHRVRGQKGVTANTAVKTALTGAALATTAYSGILGTKIAAAGRDAEAAGATTPDAGTPDDVAAAQKRLRTLQWATPALALGVVVLGAQQGEQQRPTEVVAGFARKLRSRV
ncbi:hypothetical protein [Kineosporia sp. A_224]|uniref:hypothetical protein n=1 Tax=Kineosporia sp. A_224 TaxID=1962180 RepID=UPI000B4BF476|nr:hypothetical protein [Kineosporia sp. A_224]